MSITGLASDIIHSLVVNEASTALSPKIKNLLCVVGMQENSTLTNSVNLCEAVVSQGFIDFNLCADILPSGADLPVDEYYERSVAAISGVFRLSQDILKDLSCEEFVKTYGEYFLWTKNPELFQECFKLLTDQDGARDHLSLLLLCAGFERALGNLYLLRGQQCPLMLKDLLAAQELEDILGQDVISVLQVVIGPPTSMNIRNVSWHGFLSENELPRRYTFFLLLVVASLGKVLQTRGINSGDIIARDYFPLEKSAEICHKLDISELSDAEITSLEQSVLNSWLVSSRNINFFKTAVFNYKHGKFGSCVVLLLPLLEHALRNIFVTTNKCPDRLVTAEATTLYTTFEQILDSSLPDGMENVLVQVLGEPCMDLLHDLLIYPSGPRVRDKLGHGEADYHCVPECLAHILFVIFTNLAEIADVSHQTCMTNLLGMYSSVFHPVVILQQKILDLCPVAADLPVGLEISPDLETWSPADGYEIFLTNNAIFANIQETFSHILDQVAPSFSRISPPEWLHIKRRLLVPFCDVTQDVLSLLPCRVRTLYRWQKDSDFDNSKKVSSPDNTKKYPDSNNSKNACTHSQNQFAAKVKVSESEIVGILSRIIAETKTAVTQTKSALQLRQGQLVNKQLRSRQRDTLRRLLFFLPCASLLANYVAVLSSWLFCCLNDNQCLNTTILRTLQRFLKSTLQACENLRTLTSGETNKWSQAGEVVMSELRSPLKFSQLNIFSVTTEAARGGK